MKATEEHKKKMREYRKNHREKYNEYQKKYYQTHREYYINYSKNKYNGATYRIAKAIEYIENHFDSKNFRWGEWNDKEIEVLLDILKGSDSNE